MSEHSFVPEKVGLAFVVGIVIFVHGKRVPYGLIAPCIPMRLKGRQNSMTITSMNHNPGNDSKYARHRSIWKGSQNQLRRTVASLQGTQGVQVHEYWDTPFTIDSKFYGDWGVFLKATRAPPKGREILGSWDIKPPSQKLERAVPGSLRSDLKLLWGDFMLITARRIGFSSGAGADNTDRYHGKSVLVFAAGPSSFDFIVSKYGYGDELKKNHHFYHWQSRDKSFHGLVNVDDYQGEEGLTFYVVS